MMLKRPELTQEILYIFALESAVAPAADAIDLDRSFIAPPPYGIVMNVQHPGYFFNRQ
jgi:hypothetical protein